MDVPLLDLKLQYSAIKSEIDTAVAEVFESQHFVLGPKVLQCEKAIAEYSACSYAIGMSSGSDSLLACLLAMRSLQRLIPSSQPQGPLLGWELHLCLLISTRRPLT